MDDITTPDVEKLVACLGATTDPYPLGVNAADVDWEAVYSLRHRAPRHVTFPKEMIDRWDDGEWVYVRRDGTLTFDEAHVTALGYADADTAAIYRRATGSDSELYWQRRWLYTAMLTRAEQQRIEAKTQPQREGGEETP